MNNVSIGIDIGSTSIKGVLLKNDSKELLRVVSLPLRSRLCSTSPAYYEEDANSIREDVFAIIKELASDPIRGSLEITGIAFTGQMHGGVFLDEAFEPLSPFITWQDKRLEEKLPNEDRSFLEKLRTLVEEDDWLTTGSRIYAGYFIGTAYWYLQKKLVPPTTRYISGVHDWIASTLTGKHTSDPSTVAAWGVYSIRDKAYSQVIVDALNISKEWLPEIIPMGKPIGNILSPYIQELGLSASTIVYSGTGDTQASYIGSGATKETLLINFGTGSQLMWEIDSFHLFPGTDTRLLSDSRYLITVPTLAGGKAYALLADAVLDLLEQLNIQVSKEQVYELLNQSAGDAQRGSKGVTIIPFFNGSRYKGEDARASILGLTRENFKIGNLSRAMLEGMVEELAGPYYAIDPEYRRHNRLLGSGNGLRLNTVLQEIITGRFHLPLELSPKEEEAALGAALICAKDF